jgi:hypothetical protein
MGAAIWRRQCQQQRGVTEDFLKIGQDRDGAAFAGEGWRTAERFLECASGG